MLNSLKPNNLEKTPNPIADWFEAIPAGLIIINDEAQIDNYNQSALEIFHLMQVNDKWSDVIQRNVKEIINNGDYIVSQSGKNILFKTQSLPNKKGQLVLLLDETQLKNNNESEIKRQKLQSIEKLSATLAQQLHTPLATALFYAANLNASGESSAQINEYQVKIVEQLQLIQDQIDEALLNARTATQFLNKNNPPKLLSAQDIIQEDIAIKHIVQLCHKVAHTDASVLICGESGTGKEVFAKFIHDHSPRKDHPFIAINCAAIPDNMLESLLFGYEKGAFTGAYQTVEGKLERGNSGTVLLDEISEMPIALQAKLLRVIQEREVERLGGKKIIKLNIRIIATTNRLLTKEIAAGNFRQDLYFRLNVFPLLIPPLRSRPKDILPLAHYFINYFKKTSTSVLLSNAAKQRLLTYAWPGNIRELQNIIQRALIYSKNNEINDVDIQFENEDTVHSSLTEKETLTDHIIDKENALILQVLHESDHNRNIAAQKLNISTRTLRTKLARMKKMGMTI